MRRKAGIRGIKARQKQEQAIQIKGDEMQAAKLEEVRYIWNVHSPLNPLIRKHPPLCRCKNRW